MSAAQAQHRWRRRGAWALGGGTVVAALVLCAVAWHSPAHDELPAALVPAPLEAAPPPLEKSYQACMSCMAATCDKSSVQPGPEEKKGKGNHSRTRARAGHGANAHHRTTHHAKGRGKGGGKGGGGTGGTGGGHGGGGCAATYADPSGAERYYCMCKCCRMQCGLNRLCSTKPDAASPPPPPPAGLAEARAVVDDLGALGNPCAELGSAVITEAIRFVGSRCVQVCLPATRKNDFLRRGLIFGRGWCGQHGYTEYETDALNEGVHAFVFAPGEGVVVERPDAGDGVAALAPPPPLSTVRPAPRSPPSPPPAPLRPPLGDATPNARNTVNFTDVNPCVAAKEEHKNVMVDATKVSGRTCTQVCLPEAFRLIGEKRGIHTGNGSCVDRGYNSFVTSGKNGGVWWYVFIDYRKPKPGAPMPPPSSSPPALPPPPQGGWGNAAGVRLLRRGR